ncbi:hypothetical protein CEE34_10970 [Candidatus Aerophobetes bacterium Ae_b3a]|nr:MAG: hypothetical protein CEE34_10970 [Candidatus Aerophobetes bacterium Ae_b3a]
MAEGIIVAGENITTILWLIQWLNDWGILILAGAAFLAPYWVARALKKYYRPKLDIEFKDELPYCRHEESKGYRRSYYCHFVVVNSGLSQADDCEAVLEKIWWAGDQEESLEWQEHPNWIPVNLKWSAEEENLMRACFKTIYPGGRRYFCDIARVWEKEGAEFKFETSWTFISQSTFRTKGKHKIQVSVYSKNAAKVTKKFIINWYGAYSDGPEEMQELLKVKMLCKNQ